MLLLLLDVLVDILRLSHVGLLCSSSNCLCNHTVLAVNSSVALIPSSYDLAFRSVFLIVDLGDGGVRRLKQQAFLKRSPCEFHKVDLLFLSSSSKSRRTLTHSGHAAIFMC
ncbi:unnamed protein product [Polarella glacialis]|uniref:Secreted protein n=1 Tax=Polarella glacialis TaxID=89957 RepID=A0A813LTX5_POLGL|nr:unnamed protein product [Polarella glacialis]